MIIAMTFRPDLIQGKHLIHNRQAEFIRQEFNPEIIMPSQHGSIDYFSSRQTGRSDRQHGSIRDHLEADAWRHHGQFAAQQAQKRQPRSNRRSLKWQDRALLALSALLLLLLIIRVETIQAQEDNWGLEFQGDNNSMRSVALDTDVKWK